MCKLKDRLYSSLILITRMIANIRYCKLLIFLNRLCLISVKGRNSCNQW